MTTMTKSEFARHINVKPGYVTQLNAAGRLVMEGDKINVEASIARIEATRDPSKAGVAERHEKARTEKQQAQTPQSLVYDEPEDDGGSGSDYQASKALNEKYKALMAKTAYEREIGQLLPIDDVRQAVLDGDVLIRSRLESLPDMLAPQIAAETDEQRVRAILIEQIEQLLTELSGSFNKLITQ